MALNIKNEDTQRLSRELANLTGETVTTAVTVAVRERLDRVQARRETPEQRAARILELGRLISTAMPRATLTIDDLYDAEGLPA